MSLARNATMTFATRAGILLVMFSTSIVVARTLGPEGRGLFSLVILAAQLVFSMTHLSIGTGSGYFLGRKGISLEQVVGSWLSLSLVIGFSALGIALVIAPQLVPRFLPDVSLPLVIVALISVPFSIITGNIVAVFRATDDFRRYNILICAEPVLMLVSFVALLLAYPGPRIEAAVIAFLASRVLAGLCAILIAAGVVRLRLHWVRGLVKRAVGFGAQAHVSSFLSFLSLRIDLVLINFFLDPVQVGYYAISVVLAEKIWLIPDVLSAVLHPKVAHGGEEEADRVTAIVGRQAFLLTLSGCLIVLLFGRYFIPAFYGDRFMPSVRPLVLLLPGVLTAGLARVVVSDLTARGYPRVILFGGSIALAANVLINIALIPRMGISGAAIATSISYSLNFFILLLPFVRLTGVSLGALLVPKPSDVRLISRRLVSMMGRKKGGGSREGE